MKSRQWQRTSSGPVGRKTKKEEEKNIQIFVLFCFCPLLVLLLLVPLVPPPLWNLDHRHCSKPEAAQRKSKGDPEGRARLSNRQGKCQVDLEEQLQRDRVTILKLQAPCYPLLLLFLLLFFFFFLSLFLFFSSPFTFSLFQSLFLLCLRIFLSFFSLSFLFFFFVFVFFFFFFFVSVFLRFNASASLNLVIKPSIHKASALLREPVWCITLRQICSIREGQEEGGVKNNATTPGSII